MITIDFRQSFTAIVLKYDPDDRYDKAYLENLYPLVNKLFEDFFKSVNYTPVVKFGRLYPIANRRGQDYYPVVITQDPKIANKDLGPVTSQLHNDYKLDIRIISHKDKSYIYITPFHNWELAEDYLPIKIKINELLNKKDGIDYAGLLKSIKRS